MIIVLAIVALLFTVGIAFYVRTTQMPIESNENEKEQHEVGFCDLTNTTRPSFDSRNHSFRATYIATTRKPDPFIINSPTLYSSQQQLPANIPSHYDEESPYGHEDSPNDPYYTDESFKIDRLSGSPGRGSRFTSENNVTCFFPPVGPSIFDNTEFLVTTNSGESDLEFPVLVRLRLDKSSLEMTKQLSSGAYSSVWLGKYEEQFVVVKQMKPVDDDIADAFAKEIAAMSGLIHSNIVHFIGCTWTSRMDLSSVTEYIDGGDLRSFLQLQSSSLEWKKDKISIAMDIVKALCYLHSLKPVVLCRVLKAQKVVIEDQLMLIAKLTDFTINAACYDKYLQAKEAHFVRWIAPEVLAGNNVTESADIYSFGVLLSELDTHNLPYEDRSLDSFDVATKVSRGELRPTFTAECPKVIQQIADACLQFDPDNRPRSNVLLEMLKQARIQLKL